MLLKPHFAPYRENNRKDTPGRRTQHIRYKDIRITKTGKRILMGPAQLKNNEKVVDLANNTEIARSSNTNLLGKYTVFNTSRALKR